MEPTVCVIIPTYNRAEFIDECILSILGQTRKADRIIVVNDGSTDNTLEVLKKFSPQIEVYSKSNGGRASAVNFGVALSTDDYIWIADDDDIALSDGLENLYKALTCKPDAALAYGDYRGFYDSDPARHPQIPQRSGFTDTSAKISFLYGMFTFQFAMLFRRKNFIDLGGMREDMPRCSDFEFTLRITRHNKAVSVQHVIFLQRWHDGDRGIAGQRFSSREIERKGIVYDGMAFSDVLNKYDLSEFCPTFALNFVEPIRTQACLVLRGLLSFKFAIWDQFISDIMAAKNISPHPYPRNLLLLEENFLTALLPLEILSEDKKTLDKMKDLFVTGGLAEYAVLGISRPLIWNAKNYFLNGDYLKSTRLVYIGYKMLGIRGLIKRVLKSCFS